MAGHGSGSTIPKCRHPTSTSPKHISWCAHTYICYLLAPSGALVSSVRSSSSHPDLLLIHHHHPPTFSVIHRSSTLDFHFLSHYSYIKAIMLYKGNHWTRCAGFMVASWVQLGITNDDLGISWALPGDNLGMTWG